MRIKPVTIATVTYEGSFVCILDFLIQIKPAIENYPGICELLIINNSGEHAAESTEYSLVNSNIREVCESRVIPSNKNNISTARNIALKEANHDLLIFLDDDEFPVLNWIHLLVSTSEQFDAQLVSGPTYPIFLHGAPNWVKTVDLHNTQGKTTGLQLEKSGAGNLLISRSAIVGDHFDEVLGTSGGEDTEFVYRQVASGLKLVWCKEAAAYEYMPKNKSTASYFIKRFVVQGNLHREIMIEVGSIKYRSYFYLKSILMVTLSLVIAPVLLLISSKYAGRWVKRGFANIGHLSAISKNLYPATSGESSTKSK